MIGLAALSSNELECNYSTLRKPYDFLQLSNSFSSGRHLLAKIYQLKFEVKTIATIPRTTIFPVGIDFPTLISDSGSKKQIDDKRKKYC